MSVQSELTRIKNAVTDAKAALVEQGITVPENAKVESIGPLIRTIICPDVSKVTAAAGNVLAGKVFVDANGNAVTGTMTNRGAVSTTVEAGGTYTIPAGYHNGSGKVTSAASSGYQVKVGTHSMTTASTSITITHGLGKTPVYGCIVVNKSGTGIAAPHLMSYKLYGTGGLRVTASSSSTKVNIYTNGTVSFNDTTATFSSNSTSTFNGGAYTYQYIIVG